MKRTIAVFAALLFCAAWAGAAAPSANENSIFKRSVEQYDSLLASWYKTNINLSPEQFYDYFINIDSTAAPKSNIPDSVYIARLKMIFSPIQMPYNEIVKRYLVVYTQSRKETMGRILGLSQYYFPMIEQELARYGIPLEMRMLPVIESALNPTAISRAGATGLWQFMYNTGRIYDLEVSSFIDQRCDPMLSTIAACRHLKDLYRMYGDWTLAISAYNCGAGNVNKAMRRAGDGAKTFWDIYPYLPRETRGYYPAFIAATYAYKFHQQHGITPVAPPIPVTTDTVLVNRVMHLGQVASTLGLSMETLRELNPQYRLDVIPAVGQSYPLRLPVRDIPRFIDRQREIYAKDTIYLKEYFRSGKDLNAEVKKHVATRLAYHKVRKGESLSTIARKYHVTVTQLKSWNRLRNNTIRAGQTLRIQKR
ncbi:MAG: transglycosylase SLT domain-containing protein [Rikenellaceae bacterium]|jgi:membrane-bound lytic murein transglycosylase D|nr:transglycosylase SLT domain-containing protein [Rikenellaceae bacterium]